MSIIETGHFCLILAWGISFLQILGLAPSLAAISVIKTYARLQFFLIVISFLSLTYAYVISDFSVLNVVNNSHTLKPLIYKIAGVWGNHEGSMLLWVLVLALFGSAMSWGKFSTEILRSRAIGIQGFIGFLMLGFIIFTSSPFERIFPPEANGTDLNPLLQDIGLAMHPPLLYGGYVGFSAVFSIAIACLMSGHLGRAEGKLIHHWCRIAWISLTAGIGLGMWWAYYELGWGGFWFWDPVENASLMPWLAGTALLHSAIILAKRELLKSWVILLSIFTFTSTLLGTFIVRSGIITSVHSFASSPERGMVILIIASICIGASLIIYAVQSDKLRSDPHYALFSKEGALILNNYLLSGILLIVVTGTLYPTFLEALTGDKISVGAPYFNSTIAPLFYGLMAFLPLSGFIMWHKGRLKSLVKPVAIMSVITIGAWIAFMTYDINKAAYGLLLAGIWVISGTILELILRSKASIRKAMHILLSETGKFASHFAVGIVLIGIAGAGVLKTEATFLATEGQILKLDTNEFTMVDNQIITQDNYQADQVTINHINDDTVYYPQRRFYPVAKQTTSEADIHLFWDKDIYITAGTVTNDNKRQINIRIHPFVGFLWGGIMLAVLGNIWMIYRKTTP
ncbi:MAG: cytochrome c-type biogenesis protein CcmF [Alphaproteobacteria bacterium]|jgi:cytochrome c-type biogenesis protein CcmF